MKAYRFVQFIAVISLTRKCVRCEIESDLYSSDDELTNDCQMKQEPVKIITNAKVIIITQYPYFKSEMDSNIYVYISMLL